MPYEIIAREDGILEVVHTGEMSMDVAALSRRESGAIMTEQNLRQILVDIRQTHFAEPDMVDVFEFNASYYEDFPPFSRVACLIPVNPEIDHVAEFAQTVAMNRGIMFRLFHASEDAVRWLKGNGDGGG